MIRDPEEMREQRTRNAMRSKEASSAPAASMLEAGRQPLASGGTVDHQAAARQWLCRFRSDRHSVEAIAADEGCTVAMVRAGIEHVLQLEGSSLALLEQSRAAKPRAHCRAMLEVPQ
jgi:hypothetical protein